ncbi:hypothetical protein GYMLUDRAFT_64383 [Collybiopsis luxurians FD-317 M1]|uniref:Uncharacterized protein n=1 Tax=Collybiopsis luxurians FD-317 M1 TaxID=944289 RepID=A0A0D0APH9_9AGAR|nr:hypothetical protein GYMLUDRAFT_64383 [Collybiopsis luxurians FD-317 M1]
MPHWYSRWGKPVYHQAHSTLPEPSHRTLVYTHPPPPPPPSLPIHSDFQSGAKCTAQAAFSPTSASFSNIPTKCPISISLQIPLESSSYNSNSRPNSSSPLEGLQLFAKMLIDLLNTHSHLNGHHPLTCLLHVAAAVEVVTPATNATTICGSTAPLPPLWSSVKHPVMPVTLSTAYALDERRRSTAPQNLSSYYSFSTSSANDSAAPYYGYKYQYTSHPPPLTYTYRFYLVNVQLASMSPVNHISHAPPLPMSFELIPRMVGHLMSSRSLAMTTTLPHFYETDWTGGKRHVYGEVRAGADTLSLALPLLYLAAPAPPFLMHLLSSSTHHIIFLLADSMCCVQSEFLYVLHCVYPK